MIAELERFEVKGADGQPSSDLVFGSTRHPGQPYAFVTSWKRAMEAANIKNFRFHDIPGARAQVT